MAVSLDSYSDIEDSDVDSLTELFNKAAEHVKHLVSSLETPKLLEIYSYYKQATEGTCNIPKPRFYEMQAKAKWEAWNKLGQMNSDDAKKNYIRIISELDSNFDPLNFNNKSSESWVTVSSLLNTDEILDDDDKNIFDFVKEGNLAHLVSIIQKDSKLLNIRDENGLSLIHWAADRGNVDILEFLIKSSIDINLTDNEGQTALHYAASCDHFACVELLINSGANASLNDTDGTRPVDLASDSKIVELLKGQM